MHQRVRTTTEEQDMLFQRLADAEEASEAARLQAKTAKEKQDVLLGQLMESEAEVQHQRELWLQLPQDLGNVTESPTGIERWRSPAGRWCNVAAEMAVEDFRTPD